MRFWIWRGVPERTAEDVGVNAGAIMGLGKDGVAGDHLTALLSLKSLKARYKCSRVE